MNHRTATAWMALVVLRAQVLSLGHSGVREVVIDRLLAMLNRGVVPRIPAQGSVGASGDLAPLAHLALVLIGEGEARYEGALIYLVENSPLLLWWPPQRPGELKGRITSANEWQLELRELAEVAAGRQPLENAFELPKNKQP